MNKQRIQQAAALLDLVVGDFDDDERINDLQTVGREWAKILNAHHTPHHATCRKC